MSELKVELWNWGWGQRWASRKQSVLLHINRDVFVWFVVQVKYKEACKKETSSSLFHLMPETPEMQFAKQMSEIQSVVRLCSLSSHTDIFHSPVHFNVLLFLFIDLCLFLFEGKVQTGQRGSSQHFVLTAARNSGDSVC